MKKKFEPEYTEFAMGSETWPHSYLAKFIPQTLRAHKLKPVACFAGKSKVRLFGKKVLVNELRWLGKTTEEK